LAGLIFIREDLCRQRAAASKCLCPLLRRRPLLLSKGVQILRPVKCLHPLGKKIRRVALRRVPTMMAQGGNKLTNSERSTRKPQACTKSVGTARGESEKQQSPRCFPAKSQSDLRYDADGSTGDPGGLLPSTRRTSRRRRSTTSPGRLGRPCRWIHPQGIGIGSRLHVRTRKSSVFFFLLLLKINKIKARLVINRACSPVVPCPGVSARTVCLAVSPTSNSLAVLRMACTQRGNCHVSMQRNSPRVVTFPAILHTYLSAKINSLVK